MNLSIKNIIRTILALLFLFLLQKEKNKMHKHPKLGKWFTDFDDIVTHYTIGRANNDMKKIMTITLSIDIII